MIQKIFKFVFNNLARETTSGKFIPEIDGLRFVAILPVVIMHFFTQFKENARNIPNSPFFTFLNNMFELGGTGVILFFSISGFILSKPFAEYYLKGAPKPNLSKYFKRRLTRLEPPYLISLLILYLSISIYQNISLKTYLPNFLAGVFYLHYIIYGYWNPINPVTWSLEVEVQFYILAPLLASAYIIKNPIFRALILSAIIIFWSFVFEANRSYIRSLHLYKTIVNYLPYFLIGFLFSAFIIGKTLNERKSILWDIIGFCALFAMFYLGSMPQTVYRILLCIVIFLLFFSSFRGKILNYFLTRKIITMIGGMCYSIYLLHYPVLSVFVILFYKILPMKNFWYALFLYGILIIPFTLLISTLFYAFFEKPFMRKDWHLTILKNIKNPVS